MEKKEITEQEAKEVWEKVKDNAFVLIYYPTFEDYWAECERINDLPENKWQKLVKRNLDKLNILKGRNKLLKD